MEDQGRREPKRLHVSHAGLIVKTYAHRHRISPVDNPDILWKSVADGSKTPVSQLGRHLLVY